MTWFWFCSWLFMTGLTFISQREWQKALELADEALDMLDEEIDRANAAETALALREQAPPSEHVHDWQPFSGGYECECGEQRDYRMEPVEQAPPPESKVTDLMAALEQSLEAAKKARSPLHQAGEQAPPSEEKT